MPSCKPGRCRILPLLLLYGLGIGFFVFVVWRVPRAEIPELLKAWVPWTLRVNFLLLAMGFLLCAREILDLAKSLWTRKGAALAGLLIAGFVLVSFAAPRTGRIFYDEQIYANIGQNIALTDRAAFCNYGTFENGQYVTRWLEYNKQPNGWPFLMSLVFQAFGVRELYAYLLNNLLFCGNMLLAFFLSWLLTRSFFAGFCSALILALIPHNILWSNTCTVEPAAAFLAGLTVLFTALFFHTDRTRYLFLLGVTLPLACQMRTESLLIGLWVLAAFLVLGPRVLVRTRFWTVGAAVFFLLIPHLLHLYAFGDHSWGAQGARFSVEFFWKNLKMNGLYFLTNQDFPVLFTLFFLAGLACTHCPGRWRFLIFSWFLLFWGVFLFYYAGGYRYGADVRYALVVFPPFAVLGGMGAPWLRDRIAGRIAGPIAGGRRLAAGLILALILLPFLWHFPLVRQEGWEAWASRADVKFAKRFMTRMPERSIVLTHTPSMFLLQGKNAIQAHAGVHYPALIHDLMTRYQGGVFFHHGYWCNTRDDAQMRICTKIEEKYDLEPVDRAVEQDYEYVLYRMKRKPLP